ncbi:unnamed protein product [Acanthoscelides obtectus]|uniref:CUB domain-containing protein n=1 Tax=Acanthoscelides obtectus TaxID=200917 RepID=A0A9P0PS48_ACAOB|nr:unnamed protein product [Acanthoscelides obtectus]CAK1640635.1 hypothetical protein AOBTE_LOCUS11832 [Acanthoscelides obtectus]
MLYSKEKLKLTETLIAMEKKKAYCTRMANCLNRADIIRVYDGRSTSAPSIRLLCNEGAEYEVLSTGSELLVEFVANSDRPGRGFRAKYQFQPAVDDTSVDTLKYSRLGGSSFGTEVEPNVSETSGQNWMKYA